MKCPECQIELPEGFKFCKECGTKLELSCPGCSTKIPTDSKFCPECGYDLRKLKEAKPLDYDQPHSYTPKHLADKILTNRSSIEGERKIVTVMFADVARSTAIFESLDPEAVHEIMDGCFRILMDEIHRYEGTINQFTGDGVMALFGAPITHEDHAQRACHAALAIQRGLVPFSDKLRSEYGIDFNVRIGLNSGPVIVAAIGDDLRMDYTAQGDTANLAARMESSAEPGTVLVSGHTHMLAKDFFHFEPKGPIKVKGKEEPQPAYQLVRPKKVRSRLEASVARGLTEFTGRESELEVLQAAFERVKHGEAQIVDVVGEAGVGKSRIVYEFRRTVGNEATFISGSCVQYGRNINFLPVIEVARASFGIEEGMTEDEVSNLIFKKAAHGLGSMTPFFRDLLSLRVDDPLFQTLDPEARKFGTFEAIKSLLLALVAERPLIIFLEDVHWIDKLSEDLFTYFSRSMFGHPVLMIAAYRPEGSPAWASGPHYERLGLETLGFDSSIKLVRNIVSGVPLDPELEKRIVDRTAGNPFFVEEVVRELIERKELVLSENRYVPIRSVDDLEIPNTIQGVLAARMDRLSEDLKRTMQVASVIGRDFAFRVLNGIITLGDDLRTHLANLVGLQVLYEKSLYPELEYIFKHALTQEVAYESLLKKRRQEIHERVARTIEQMYADRLQEHYEILAYHYGKSQNVQKAIDYLILAGEKSIRTNAVLAARDFFEAALNVVKKSSVELLPDKEIRLHKGLGTVSSGIGDFGQAVQRFYEAADLSRHHGMIEHERESLQQLVFFMYQWPVAHEAEAIISKGAARARALEDIGLQAGHEGIILARRAFYGGNLTHSISGLAKIETVAIEAGDFQTGMMNRLARLAFVRWRGQPELTVELSEGLVEMFRSQFHLFPLAIALDQRAISLAELGRIDEAITALKFGIETSERFGVRHRLATFYNCLGYCYGELWLPHLAEAHNLQSEDMSRAQARDFPMGRHQYLEAMAQAKVNLMENLFMQGKADTAWNAIVSFKEESKSHDYDFVRSQWESRMNFLAAEILLGWDRFTEAEEIILSGLVKARERGTKKREGCLLRLLGELQAGRGEMDAALENMNQGLTVLKEVGNVRQIWQAHASLAKAFQKLGRSSQAREQWGLAAKTIFKVANGISEAELRKGFLIAEPIRQILSNTQ
jgi:class 3 adenylate cyclase/tetratricopeptide (TPR) repeat protein